MAEFLGCLFIFLIVVPLLIFGGIGMWFWNLVNKNNPNGQNNNQRFSSGQNTYRNGNSQYSANGGNASGKDSGNQGTSSHKQIFKDDEGEYVDFQEIDE